MSRTRAVIGDYNAICDRCGFKFKASKLRKTWDGLYVCSKDWEPRHPSDFARKYTEDTTVPWVRTDDRQDAGLTRYVADEDPSGLGSGLYVSDTYVEVG